MLKSSFCLSGTKQNQKQRLFSLSPAALPTLLPFTSPVSLTLLQILLPSLPASPHPPSPYLDFVHQPLCLPSHFPSNSSPFIHLHRLPPHPFTVLNHPSHPALVCLPSQPPPPPPLSHHISPSCPRRSRALLFSPSFRQKANWSCLNK